MATEQPLVRASTPAERAEYNNELAAMAKTVDFSSFEMSELEAEVAERDAQNSENSTSKETEEQPPQGTENRGNSTEKGEEAITSQDQNETDITKSEAEAAPKRIDANAPKNTNANTRIRDLVAQNKARDQKIAELEAKLNGQPAKAEPQAEVKEQHAIPPPYEKKPDLYKSNFTEEQLEKIIATSDDDTAKAYAREELNKIQKSEQRVTRWEAWEARNQQAWEKQQSYEAHYSNEALKRWPSLNNVESPEYKEYVRIMERVNKIEPAFLKKPEARLVLAEVMDWRLRSNRVDAAEAEVKKLKEEIQGFRKARQPLLATGTQSVGEVSDDLKPQSVDELAAKIRAARRG